MPLHLRENLAADSRCLEVPVSLKFGDERFLIGGTRLALGNMTCCLLNRCFEFVHFESGVL